MVVISASLVREMKTNISDSGPGRRLLPLWPNKGSSRLESLAECLRHGPICQTHATNYWYFRFQASYRTSTHYAPSHGDMVFACSKRNQ